MKQMGAGMREVQDHGQDCVCERRALDEEAFTELVHAIAPRLLWTAFRIVQNWADAEDVVQSALLNAWRHAYEYRRDGVFSTRVRSILVNEARTLPRRQKFRHRTWRVKPRQQVRRLPSTSVNGSRHRNGFASWPRGGRS